jgi:hypothetical protein
MQGKAKNEIIKYVEGIPVRKTNKVTLVLHYKDYERILTTALSVGINVSQMIRLMCGPCQNCKTNKIIIPLATLGKCNHKSPSDERQNNQSSVCSQG